jgi:uncharacterized protein
MTGTALIAGFTLGAAGSLHCMGMCGPLSLALPTHHLSGVHKFISLFLYQFGRVVTYSAAGLLFGIAGHRIYLSGYQQWFSIGMGTLIALIAAFYFFKKQLVHIRFFNRFYLSVQGLIVKVLQSSTGTGGFLLLGMANGLLPCGMVYIALASTLSFTSVGDSVGFMAMFGTGTMPAMLLVAYAGQAIKYETRSLLRKAVPYFILGMGVLLILRGLNLGVPYISPQLPEAAGQAVICHP